MWYTSHTNNDVCQSQILLDSTNQNTRKMKSYNILHSSGIQMKFIKASMHYHHKVIHKYPRQLGIQMKYKSVNALLPQVIHNIHDVRWLQVPWALYPIVESQHKIIIKYPKLHTDILSEISLRHYPWYIQWLTVPTTSLVTAGDDCLSQWIRPVLHVGVSDILLGDDPSQSPDTGRRQWARPGLPLTDSAG